MNNEEVIHQAFGLIQKGMLVEAKAISLFLGKSQETVIDAISLLGVIAFKEHHYKEATEHMQSAIEARPAVVGYYNILGNIYKAEGKEIAAIEVYRQGLSIDSSNVNIGLNLARILRSNGGENEALEIIQKLASQNGAATFAAMLASWQLFYTPSSLEHMTILRQNYEQAVNELSAINGLIDEEILLQSATNFLAVYQGKDDRKFQELIANFYIRACPTLSFKAPHLDELRTEKLGAAKISIGFISTNFRNHTVGKLFRGIIANLDREVFEVSVFGDTIEDDIALFIKEHCDQFHKLPHSLSDAREVISRAQLDILVYADIGMEILTYFLAFSRLAKVQCVSWGHGVTTGLPTIDYFITGLHLQELELEKAQSHYTEKLVRLSLPPTYLYPFQVPALKDTPGLSFADAKTLYVCLQALFKIHPDFDALLISVLQRDLNGVAIFIEGQAGWSDALRARWQVLDPEINKRIHFLPRQNQNGFLALAKAADVILDTIYTCGGISSAEALSQGTPVVTWPNSDLLFARATTAYYTQIDVLDCVAYSADEYINIAVRLGTDMVWRETIEARIKENNHLLFKREEVLQELSAFFQSVI